MAQPNGIIIKYLGAIKIDKGEVFLGSTVAVGSVLQMKTKNIQVSINGSDTFIITYDDMAVVDTTATYKFSDECIIAYGEMVPVI